MNPQGVAGQGARVKGYSLRRHRAEKGGAAGSALVRARNSMPYCHLIDFDPVTPSWIQRTIVSQPARFRRSGRGSAFLPPLVTYRHWAEGPIPYPRSGLL